MRFWSRLKTKYPSINAALLWACLFAVLRTCFELSMGLPFGCIHTEVRVNSIIIGMLMRVVEEVLRAFVLFLLEKTRVKHRTICIITAVMFIIPELLMCSYVMPDKTRAYLLLEILLCASNSTLLTVLSFYGGAVASGVYCVLHGTVNAFVPFQAALPAQLKMVSGLLLIIMFLITLDCEFGSHNQLIKCDGSVPKEKRTKKLIIKKLLKGSCAALAAIMSVCFFSGLLPWQPISVATGSMEPGINIGDMLIIDKNSEDIDIGDVIQFKRGSNTVVHRVVEISRQNGETRYITKGDANNANDPDAVSLQDVIGKVAARIPYAGLLTLWLHGRSI